jgi:hypothetical protein
MLNSKVSFIILGMAMFKTGSVGLSSGPNKPQNLTKQKSGEIGKNQCFFGLNWSYFYVYRSILSYLTNVI